MANRRSNTWILLTPEQWCGVGVLVVLGLGTLCGFHFKSCSARPETAILTDSTSQVLHHHRHYQDSLRSARYRQSTRQDIAISRHSFDPNTADSLTLLQQGFRPWQVRNMLKYRAKGGRYRRPQDLKRLYGMTDSLYVLLEPYICIADSFARPHRLSLDSNAFRWSVDSLGRRLPVDSVSLAYKQARDSMARLRPIKKDTVLNLRTADTTQLKWIRGIGSYRAKEIVRYRQRLGGFTDVQQLAEIPALQSLGLDTLMAHFYLDTIVVTQLSVNHTTVTQLQRHPYLSFTQAQALYTLRRKRVRLQTIQELSALPEFTADDLHRLQPYLSFVP